MLLHCCYTPAHEVLYRQVFLPSVPEGFEIRAYRLDIDGPGDYLSREFLRCIQAKLDLVVASVASNEGEVIVWSDVDIRLFDISPAGMRRLMEESGRDILFQRESPRLDDVNTGFFVCRCCPAIERFFRTVREGLKLRPSENEQMVVNRLLSGKCEMRNETLGMKNGEHEVENEKRGVQNLECGKDLPANAAQNTELSWGYLPLSFYARTHGWPPPVRPSIYHANYTKGPDAIGQKLDQFREVERLVSGGWGARLFSIFRHGARRILSA